MERWKEYIDWENKGISQADWYEINSAKLAAAVLALMIAKAWNPLLRAGWRWYALALALASALPVYRVLKREASEPQEQ